MGIRNLLAIILVLGLAIEAKSQDFNTLFNTTKPEVVVKEPVNISLLLPFCLNRADSNQTSTTKSLVNASLDYYQGARLALALSKSTTPINLDVKDTDLNSEVLEQMQLTNQLQDKQLVVGPAFTEQIASISNYLEYYQIPIISPLSDNNLTNLSNPWLINSITSNDVHARKIVEFVTKKHKFTDNILVVSSSDLDDKDFVNSVQLGFDRHNKTWFVSSLELINQENFKVEEILPFLRKDSTSIIIIASDNVPMVTSVMRYLRSKNLTHPTVVYAHSKIARAATVNIELMQALNVHAPIEEFLNYQNPKVIKFVEEYKKQFGIEPSDFAFKGYNLFSYLSNLIDQHGRDFMFFVDYKPFPVLGTTFKFESVYNNSPEGKLTAGYRNTHTRMFKFENYSLIPAY
jgi:ABC-type branched-subunit amino acid transport system substrate-binding protein